MRVCGAASPLIRAGWRGGQCGRAQRAPASPVSPPRPCLGPSQGTSSGLHKWDHETVHAQGWPWVTPLRAPSPQLPQRRTECKLQCRVQPSVSSSRDDAINTGTSPLCSRCQLGPGLRARGSPRWRPCCVLGLAGLGTDLAQMKTIGVEPGLTPLPPNTHCSILSQLHPRQLLWGGGRLVLTPPQASFTSNAPSPLTAPSFPWPISLLPLDLGTRVPSSERSSPSPAPPSWNGASGTLSGSALCFSFAAYLSLSLHSRVCEYLLRICFHVSPSAPSVTVTASTASALFITPSTSEDARNPAGT